MTATVLTFGTTTVDISTVTDAQIGACHKVYGPDNKPFYLVENSKGELDQDGNLIEYKVSYREKFGFSCNCYAGREGFIHCRKQRFCWHVIASVAAAEEEKAAMKEQVVLNATPATEKPVPAVVTDVDSVTLARVLRRSAERKPVSKQTSLRQGTGFSLMR